MPIFASVPVIRASRPTSSRPGSRAGHAMSGTAEAEPREHAALELRAGRAPGGKRPDRARQLADLEPRSRRFDAGTVAPDLGDPHRRLEAERDRQARLAVGAAEHDGVAMASRKLYMRRLDRRQVARGDRQHPLRHEAGPRAGRRPAPWRRTTPTGARSSRSRCSTRINPSVGEARPPRLLPHRLEVDCLLGTLGDRGRGAAGGWRPSRPARPPTLRAPPARSACAPRRRTARRSQASTRDARRPSYAELPQRLAHLLQRRSPRHDHAHPAGGRRARTGSTSSAWARQVRAAHARAEVDPDGRLGLVQRDVDLARALAAQQRPVAHLLRTRVEEVALEAGAAGIGYIVRPRAPARAGRSARTAGRRAAGLVEVDNRAGHLQQLRRPSGGTTPARAPVEASARR